jgi:hypothetical protein
VLSLCDTRRIKPPRSQIPHSMAAPSPSLSISELMHPLSPQQTATTPSKPASPTPRQKSPTPEPLAPAEIEEMRKKVFAMGWGDSSKGKEKAASREDELAVMVSHKSVSLLGSALTYLPAPTAHSPCFTTPTFPTTCPG